MANIHVFSGHKVLLPDREEPTSASVVVDLDTGKIVEIVEGLYQRSDFPRAVDNDHWTEAGDNVIIPGLIE
jgi:hypothetical protein